MEGTVMGHPEYILYNCIVSIKENLQYNKISEVAYIYDTCYESNLDTIYSILEKKLMLFKKVKLFNQYPEMARHVKTDRVQTVKCMAKAIAFYSLNHHLNCDTSNIRF